MDHVSLGSVFVLLLGVILVLTLLNGWDLKRFLRRMPELRDGEDLARFKRVVAWHMYAVLELMALLFGTVLVGAASLYLGSFGWNDLLAVSMLGLAFTFFSVWIKQIEARVQTIPTPDNVLRDERDRVVKTWRSRLFPDW